jgi:apolipoprotein N-acyltransferase
MLVMTLLIPIHRQTEHEKTNISVALLQGNIPQNLKFNSGRELALQWYKEQSLNSQAQITVLPETALPYLQKDLPEDYWQSLERKFSGSQQIAILGMLTLNDAGYANSAVAIGLQTTPSLYNKFHLVPFGEFTPYMFKWFTQMMSLGMTDFTRGSDAAAPFDWQHHKISVNICYEDVFGEELAKRFVQGDANVPSILVNISNIDWFGDTVVIPQHLNIARMRSLEFDRPSIRATNSGGTAIINAQGEITHQLLPFTRGVLKGEVASIDKEITPFAYWAGHWGLKPLWILCLALLAWLIRQAKKNQNNGQGLAAANVK